MKRPAAKPPIARLTLPAMALCLTPLISLPASGAEPETSQRSTPAAASRAAFDKESGLLRAPEADEAAAGASSQSATARSRTAAPQSMLQSPNALRFQPQTIYGREGGETRRLDLARALRFSVAHRHADGTLHKDCLVGEDAVHTHLSNATATKGANHE